MKLTDDVEQRKQKHFKQYRTAKQKLTNKENLVRFLHRGKPIYFGQRRDKQTATETIICRLAAGNFEDETVSVQNIIYRMTAKKLKYETNSTQMRFVE